MEYFESSTNDSAYFSVKSSKPAKVKEDFSTDSFMIMKPMRIQKRWKALTLIILITLGPLFCFDTPGELQMSIQDKF